jgi:hypothetical protein
VVGTIEGDVLVKHVDKDKHMLRRPRGWGMDLTILEEAKEAGVRTVELRDETHSLTWTAPLDAYWSKRSIFLDRGFGKQRVLLADAWNMRGEGVPEQLSMWAVVA